MSSSPPFHLPSFPPPLASPPLFLLFAKTCGLVFFPFLYIFHLSGFLIRFHPQRRAVEKNMVQILQESIQIL